VSDGLTYKVAIEGCALPTKELPVSLPNPPPSIPPIPSGCTMGSLPAGTSYTGNFCLTDSTETVYFSAAKNYDKINVIEFKSYSNGALSNYQIGNTNNFPYTMNFTFEGNFIITDSIGDVRFNAENYVPKGILSCAAGGTLSLSSINMGCIVIKSIFE
jgi:hypothetical protein